MESETWKYNFKNSNLSVFNSLLLVAIKIYTLFYYAFKTLYHLQIIQCKQ